MSVSSETLGDEPMAEFLTTRGISYELEQIIEGAEERLYLISPFLKVSKDLKELLEEKAPSVDICVIFGKSELQPDESEWLQGLDAVKTRYRKDLHAKCYLNEKKALLTSMNLYEFSEKNNDEMGVLVSKKDDPDLYDKILKESRTILNKSENVQVTFTKDKPAQSSAETPQPKAAGIPLKVPETGFCIRCGNSIPANPPLPYCNSCYRSWNRYKNDEYEEKHCHICGNEQKATMAKPACPSCYKKHKKWVDSTKK